MKCIKRILSFLKKNKRERKIKEESESFIENGSMLLEELITSSNGRYGIPIRNFCFKDLRRATCNFDERHVLLRDGFYTLYKGCLEGRLIIVKYFDNYNASKAVRDIAVTSQMSIHKNVLKLLGCCLDHEDRAVSLVYEYAGDFFLSNFLYDVAHGEIRDEHSHNRSLSYSWKHRMRIANGIANLLAYLHTALHRPVVHRDIKPGNFVIDHDGVVKLFDFSLSISIPLGETRVEDVVIGTLGFIDPEYMNSSFVTEKCDVYSFGVLLLALLTGRKQIVRGSEESVHLSRKVESCIENNQFDEIVDPRLFMRRERVGEQGQQLRAFAALALRCTREKGDDRPDMIEVAKELRRIEREL